MNAFDKFNLDTAEMLDENVTPVEAPNAPAIPAGPTDPNMTEGVEIIHVQVMSASCNFSLYGQNKDGSHITRQPTGQDYVQSKFGGPGSNGRYTGLQGYFYAKYSGPGGGFSSNGKFDLIKKAPRQNW